ncbi:hypothetical protein L5876_02910 [Hyphobacterium sp. SN044]|uniref:hypothetical protein n=1 Tax=Hyphobacterium sp. SN044 TaxID=2912575 RepID=UPI001F1E7954|nr:hypothetical protein [Hyphobacterium sp. SN044]MCF8878761.1 hypothetical protein [Hyphobacterium sp. SN044]
MNPVAWFVPGVRANGGTYFIGLLVWLVIHAGIAAAMLYADLPLPDMSGIISLVLVTLFTAFVHINRLNDAGRGWAMMLLPVLISIVIYFLAAVIMSMIIGVQMMGEYAAQNGTDMMTVAQDPALTEEFQTWLTEDETRAMAVAVPVTWVAFAGYWAIQLIFGLWFRGMQSREA